MLILFSSTIFSEWNCTNLRLAQHFQRFFLRGVTAQTSFFATHKWKICEVVAAKPRKRVFVTLLVLEKFNLSTPGNYFLEKSKLFTHRKKLLKSSVSLHREHISENSISSHPGNSFLKEFNVFTHKNKCLKKFLLPL